MTTCCPCDEPDRRCKPDIPAGLSALPRQISGFPEYRLALLSDIPRHPALDDWRAREGDDTGIMLLEMWAYVLDVLGFYDERIANESYLRPAVRRASLRKLVGLIGYRSRPALAVSVVLAAIAEGNRPVTLPARTGFRSDAFDGEPPQVFETEFEQIIHLLRNEWALAPVREPFPEQALLFDSGTAQLAPEQLVLLQWTQAGTTTLRAGRVALTRTFGALDGGSYLEVEIEPDPVLDPTVALADIEVLSPRLSAALLLSASTPATATTLILDTTYPDFGEQEPVIVQRGDELHAAMVSAVGRVDVPTSTITAAPTLPASTITFSPALPAGWSATPERLRVHFEMTSRGVPTRIAKTHLEVGDFASPGAAIAGISEPLTDNGAATTGQLLLFDAVDNGVLVSAGVSIDEDGGGRVHVAQDTPPLSPSLRTPVTVFGNLVQATRGESVFNEVLGSADGAQALQSFSLANSPLTYINDSSVPDGRRSTLEVRVNGIAWLEVPSFFGTGPEDEIYIVRHNDDEEAVVTFGDGIRGARLPTGVDNVTATYRFGAGAAKPPAGAIGQLARPVEGLRRVANPVAAGGGADADQPDDMRRNAPASALLLGRAVSTEDFAALAREFGGVLNAHVEWAWDERFQGAVVKVWFIGDGGDIASELKSFLLGQADPDTPLAVVATQAQSSELLVELEVEQRFSLPLAIDQAHTMLTDPETGLLALANVPIGQPLFRSRVFEALLSVTGVVSVRTMTLDGQPAPVAFATTEGHYRDFLDALVITAVAVDAQPAVA